MPNSLLSFFRALAVAVVLSFTAAGRAQPVLFVDDDAPPGGDGLSWATAFRSLPSALAGAEASQGTVSEIRVAQGTYTPDRVPDNCCEPHAGPGCESPDCEASICAVLGFCCSGDWVEICATAADFFCADLCGRLQDRSRSLELVNGVVLRGGHAGIGAPDPDARDVKRYESILSGDLNHDDVPGPPGSWPFENTTRFENSYHVVTAHGSDESAVLDGFTISGGHSNDLGHDRGGGLFADPGAPTVRNCRFVDNFASRPGPNLLIGAGGAVSLRGDSQTPPGGRHGTAALQNCAFANNSAASGGAVALFGIQAALSGCAFTNNTAQQSGGALALSEALATVSTCLFEGNDAGLADGILNSATSTLSGEGHLGDGTVNMGGATIHPGIEGPGIATVSAGYNQQGGRLVIEIAGRRPTEYDILWIDGFSSPCGDCVLPHGTPGCSNAACEALVCGFDAFCCAVLWDAICASQAREICGCLGQGLLSIVLLDGFRPVLGDRFTVVNAVGFNDFFDAVLMPGLPDGLFMRLEYGAPAGPGGGESAVVVVDSLASLFGFGDPESVAINGLPADVVVGDVDLQNGPDLAIALADDDAGTPGSVLVLLNAGTDELGNWLGFAGSVQIPVGNELSGITAGLFDGDELLDLAVSNSDGDNIFALLNQGGGTFDVQPPIPVGNDPRDLAAADFNGDDAVDLVVANFADNNLRILNGNGGGGFAQGPALPTGSGPVAAEPSDLDNDKDTDAVSANAGSDSVSVIVNLGGGIFDSADNYAVGADPVALGVADLDGDPDTLPEIVTANNGDATVSVLRNDGVTDIGLLFRSAVSLPVGDGPRSLAVVDLELDGDRDLAVVADDKEGNAVVQILRNDLSAGQLIFADGGTVDAGENPALVTTGDLDADGAEDLVAITEGIGADQEPAAAGGATGPAANVLINEFCAADADNDGEIGPQDLQLLLDAWGPCPAKGPCPGDVDDNGTVDIRDLLLLLGDWGTCAGAPRPA